MTGKLPRALKIEAITTTGKVSATWDFVTQGRVTMEQAEANCLASILKAGHDVQTYRRIVID